ncbi:glycosyltransferase [Methanocella arvoryzae]|uniref:GDP-Man:Man(1)GlcNAc(2)-PP-Dol alpha-1,3-mannosyltransferase n=1 Tax=Methanocella arvoryzae (strain DSM 22066 / NBRC 105507 / MRE50) TaxID=351160 RepID=Q0W7E4_METAR|nr:glycosyltransferase [Methanocella arvoryzae]CAJ35699.1 glycosyltransferase (group 1) [Methanocella arvoryzae MRE50]
MKIAIFHDHFSFIGGGEKLVLTMARHLGADVISTDVDRRLIELMGFGDVKVISLGRLCRTPPLRQIQSTIKFASCDFRKQYDFFIFSGNWAHHASNKHKPNLFYCHTPVRAFYDQRDTMAKSMNPVARIAFLGWTAAHSWLDRRSVRRVDRIACNSQNTAGRIKKYLSRDATVIYPPVDTSRYRYICDDGFWLSVNRLYPEKRIEVQIEAFRRMPEEKLVIIGNCGVGDHSVEYAAGLKKDLPPNVTVISDVAEEQLIDYYGRCRGLIITAADEDFGMTVIEAMAAGKPVIAVAEGGYLETIADGVTGKFIECIPEDIVRSVKDAGRGWTWSQDECKKRSEAYDTSKFICACREAINRLE